MHMYNWITLLSPEANTVNQLHSIKIKIKNNEVKKIATFGEKKRVLIGTKHLARALGQSSIYWWLKK